MRAFSSAASVFLLLAMFTAVLINLQLPWIPPEVLEIFGAANILGFILALVRRELRFRQIDKSRKHRRAV